MTTYLFQAQFASSIEMGFKRSTIRQTDKGVKVGHVIFLNCEGFRSLGMGEITGIYKIALLENTIWINGFCHSNPVVFDLIAIAEGFENYKVMKAWFVENYNIEPDDFYFSGFIHFWKVFKETRTGIPKINY